MYLTPKEYREQPFPSIKFPIKWWNVKSVKKRGRRFYIYVFNTETGKGVAKELYSRSIKQVISTHMKLKDEFLKQCI